VGNNYAKPDADPKNHMDEGMVDEEIQKLGIKIPTGLDSSPQNVGPN